MTTPYDRYKAAVLGNPIDPNKEPSRTGTVQAFAEMQVQLEAAQAGALVFGLKSQLTATVVVPSANIMAWVTGDPVTANCGIYRNTGTAGAATWVKITDVPQFVITGINAGAGTANAIQITTDLPVPAVDGRALIIVPILANNTVSPPTVAINGAAAIPIVSNSGTNITAPNGITAGMFIAGFVAGGKFRLLSDQASAAVVAAAEAAAAAAIAAAATIPGPTANTMIVSNPDGTTRSNKTFDEVALLLNGRFKAILITNADTELRVGIPFYGTNVTGGPIAGSFVYENELDLTGANGRQYAYNFGSSISYVRRRTAGAWQAWLQRFETITDLDTRFRGNWITTAPFSAIGDGLTAAQTAISACIAAQTARVNTVPAYNNMPQAPDCEIVIPSGDWHLTAPVDTGGKSVTYVIDDAAHFTSGSSAFLRGKTVRRSRSANGYPFGLLDHATGESVMVGEGSTDNSPLVTGFTNPNQVSTNDTIDLVARYTDATSTPILHTSTATFTATTCTLTTPVDITKLRAGMVIQTSNVPFERGQITSWDGTGTVITCSGGWYATPGTVASTPAAATVLFNPFHKVWGQNTNVFLLSTSYGYQATGHEIGIWNNKATPSNLFDSTGRTWGEDVVNLGPRKANLGFLARGAMFAGFLASGMDVGFQSSAYTALGYATPGTGFQYNGGGATLAGFTAAGLNSFYLTPSTMEFGVQGASNTVSIEFHTGAAAIDFDSAIRASGGDGTNGNGILSFDVLLTYARNFRPVTDNLYQLGGGSNRWTVVFATTGTINTSDARMKRFYDEYNAAENEKLMAKLIRAVRRFRTRIFQWNDALEIKGDNARFHIGFSAQECIEIMKEEGIEEPAIMAFICEDEEFEQVPVIEYEEIPLTKMVSKKVAIDEMKDGDLVRRWEILEQPEEVKETVKHVNEDGTPVMVPAQKQDENGKPMFTGKGKHRKPVMTKKPSVLERTVMRKKEIITYKDVPTGKTRLGLRYDAIMLLLHEAMKPEKETTK